jgi:hypothetical protein
MVRTMRSMTTYRRGQLVVVNVPFTGGGDHPLQHWKGLGLLHPCTARLSNLMAVEKRLIKRPLAPLHADDLARIEQGLRKVFSL